MKKMIILLSVTVSIFILIVLFFVFMFRGIANPNNILINTVEVTNDKITIRGDFTGSSMGFAGYKANYMDGQLYIKILMRNGFQFGQLRPLEFSLPNIYGTIKEIYLEGSTTADKKLIWQAMNLEKS